MTEPRAGYSYIWSYDVRPERAADFERAYGPEGPWVALFRRAPGHLRTELFREREIAHRYLTIDYWISAEACETFKASVRSEFDAIDEQCEQLTIAEHEIARLEPVGESGRQAG